MAKVEADFNQELALALKDGFTADEVAKAKKTWLDERAQQRTEVGSVAELLSSRERWDRTLLFDAKLEAAVAALTPQQVNDAFKRHIDPTDISIVKAATSKSPAPSNNPPLRRDNPASAPCRRVSHLTVPVLARHPGEAA